MKKRILLLVILSFVCLFLYHLTAFTSIKVPPATVHAQLPSNPPVDNLLILDVSDSMSSATQCPGNGKKPCPSKISAAITALDNYINTICDYNNNSCQSTTNRASLITFAKSASLNSPLTNNYTNLKNVIASAGNNLIFRTCTSCGIDVAEQEAQSHGLASSCKVAILASDGEANWNDPMSLLTPAPTLDYVDGKQVAINEALAAYQATGMSFYTIGVGTPGQNADFGFLQTIATETHGRFYQTLSAQDLNNTYQKIAAATNQSFKPGNGNNQGNGNNRPARVPCSSATPTPSPTVTPPPPALYSISGNIFNDADKNKQYNNPPDSLYSNSVSTIVFSGPTNKSVTTATGTFTSGIKLSQGTYNIFFLPPLGYKMTVPINGPPPFFKVTVGTTCKVGSSPEATCSNGNITNLNFGITNDFPWIQSSCGDIRNDNGITDLVPNGKFANITNSTCTTPGISFTGDTDSDYGNGQDSASNQEVGGSDYPEVFSTNASLDTSYASLLAKAQNAGITPTDLATVCTGGLSNCSLNSPLPHGLYLANGDVTITNNNYNFANNRDYVFLINGTLSLTGNINIPNSSSSTALFSTAKDIVVSANVGTPPSNANPSLDGWYVAGQNFIINSTGTCSGDLRLNIGGSVIVNAMGNGGTFQNNRDLCSSDQADPTVSIVQRLDMILNAPQFLRQQLTISQELAP